ncbi:MAG: transporter [Gemmatimonadaceae bacterium]
MRRTLVALAFVGAPAMAGAQTDFYNTDRNRPIRIEDAYATERYSFDAHLAPIRLERSKGGVYNWGIDPELAYGIFPRTQLELGIPVGYTDLGESRRRAGLAGIDLSVLYNLNAETTTLPALGIRASTLFPVGNLAPENVHPSIQGMVTRTLGWARFHVNAEYTFGSEPEAVNGLGAGAVELARWTTGVAVDRTFPLKSTLLTGEVYARQPIHEDEAVEWNAGVGVRHQLDPLTAVDAGFGRRLTADDRSWFVTFGLARVFSFPFLMPGR